MSVRARPPSRELGRSPLGMRGQVSGWVLGRDACQGAVSGPCHGGAGPSPCQGSRVPPIPRQGPAAAATVTSRGNRVVASAAVTAATGRPTSPPVLAEAPVSQGAPAARPCGGAAPRAFTLRRCGNGGAYLYVEVAGVEAARRDEPGLGRPQVPRHQLPGPLHQELAVPLRRHLAPDPDGGCCACAPLPRGGLSRSSAPPRRRAVSAILEVGRRGGLRPWCQCWRTVAAGLLRRAAVAPSSSLLLLSWSRDGGRWARASKGKGARSGKGVQGL